MEQNELQGENLEQNQNAPSVEVADDNSADIETLRVQKSKWREKAIKESEERKKLEEKLSALQGPKEVEKSPSVGSDATRFAKLELKIEGYNDEEADFVMKSGLGKDNQFVKAAVEAMRSKQKVVEATPQPSNRSALVNNKSFSQLSKEEKSANYSDTFKQMVDKARTRK